MIKNKATLFSQISKIEEIDVPKVLFIFVWGLIYSLEILDPVGSMLASLEIVD